MNRSLRVWGGPLGTHRGIVIASTKKRAVELLNARWTNFSRHFFDGYWSESFNDAELAHIADGESIWEEDDGYRGTLTRVVPKEVRS